MKWVDIVRLFRKPRTAETTSQVAPESTAIRDPRPVIDPGVVHVEFGRLVKGPPKLDIQAAAPIPTQPTNGLVLLDKDGELDSAALGSAAGNHLGDPRDFAHAVAVALGGDWFPSKVVGVTHRNDDRTSRQAAIKKLESLDFLTLEPEPTNQYDPNAVRVIGGYFAKDFEWIKRQIGFLDSRLAGETTRAMKRGIRYLCFVLNVTGEDEAHRGVNIAIVRW